MSKDNYICYILKCGNYTYNGCTNNFYLLSNKIEKITNNLILNLFNYSSNFFISKISF